MLKKPKIRIGTRSVCYNNCMDDKFYEDSFTQTPSASPAELQAQKRSMIGIAISVSVILVLTIVFFVFLLAPGLSTAETVARIRDVFIIVMAFESLLIGGVLVILIIQIARLTNLLQNEIKPILDSTNQTVSTLRGTTQFLSDNLSEPVIKLNEYIAALQKMVELLGLGKRKR